MRLCASGTGFPPDACARRPGVAQPRASRSRLCVLIRVCLGFRALRYFLTAFGFEEIDLRLEVALILLKLSNLGPSEHEHRCMVTRECRTFCSMSALPCSACKAFRIPKAIELSYSVWYAARVMRISSRTRRSNSPRSLQLIATWRISSSTHVSASRAAPRHRTKGL